MSPRRAKVLGGETSPGALRRHLIAVTGHLLAAHGAASLTTRQIAREAQVSDGVLYNHFAGKDELVLTAMGQRADELVTAFLAAVPEAGSGTLADGIAVLSRAVFDLQAGLLPLVSGLLGRPDLIHEFFAAIHADAGPQAAFGAGVEYLQAEQALGRAADDVDAGAVLELAFGACQLRAMMATFGPTPGQVADAAAGEQPDLDEIVAVLVRALRV